MQIHSLELDDFSDDNYTLIGIHSTLDEYKLAYVLNKELETKLVKAAFSLDFENKNNNASFTIYEFLNSKFNHSWFLISNQFTNNIEGVSTGLFQTNEITMHLIPEKKKVDYFLKLEGDFDYEYIVKVVDQINKINQVITSYTIDPNILKSKEFLIF
jgi:hypothetical protein